MEKKYFKIKHPFQANSDVSTKAKTMIYNLLAKYGNTLIYASEDELVMFFQSIIDEIEIQRDKFRKWPVLESCGKNPIVFNDTIHLTCDGVYYLDTEELKQISLDDSNPFQLNINFNEEV